MADLQEPCFTGRHSTYVIMLTIPQILIYILGLPIVGTIHLMRNKDQLHERHFYTRYGLLYLGYRDDRAWWEIVVAFRKVAVVAIGTFGTFLGVVDIQAHLVLLVVFVSIVIHLIGEPFDTTKKNTLFLHRLELMALSICWLTFWGGLLFFLGHEKAGSVSPEVKILITVGLVGTNVVFLVVSFGMFVKEHKKDQKTKEKRQTATQIVPVNSDTEIVPINGGAEDNNENNEEHDDNEEFDPEKSIQHQRRSLTHTRSTVAKAHAVHSQFHLHEEDFKNKTEQRQKKAKRKTKLRLQARIKLKDSKALHKVKVFSKFTEKQINIVIDQMDHIVRFKEDPICHQHDVSDSFYIIVKGDCVVNVDVVKRDESTTESERPEQMQTGVLCELNVFGESALLADDTQSFRNATVIVASDKCVLLRLKKSNWLEIMKSNSDMFKESHEDQKSVVDSLKETLGERAEINEKLLTRRRSETSSDGGGGDGGGGDGDGDDAVKTKGERAEINQMLLTGRELGRELGVEGGGGGGGGANKTKIIPIANDFSLKPIRDEKGV